MKKIITIILALIMTFFSAPNQGADQPPVTAEKTPQTEITVQVEQVHDESEKPAETAFMSEVTEAEITTKERRTHSSRNGHGRMRRKHADCPPHRPLYRGGHRHRTLRKTAEEA